MQEIDEKDRPRLFILCGVIAAVAYVAANWITTQCIAADLAYHELLPGRLYGHIYSPFAVDMWRSNKELASAIHATLAQYWMLEWGIYLLGAFCCYQVYRNMARMTSHGTADFAKAKDIEEAGLAAKETGFVVGRNPFNDKIMLHNGPEHILLVAPTRSGKGVCNMVPTGICWKHSIFFFDPKGELWNFTAAWRKHHMHQRVMKFEPLCKDGSAAKWNPLAEIDYQSFEELTDVSTISEMMVKTGEGGKDPFWENSAAALVNGVILHLLYKHDQERRVLPCPSDIMSFLSSPGMSTDMLFASMKLYPHIAKEDFLEIDGRRNILKEVYGEYIDDFRPFAKACPAFAEAVEKNEKAARAYEEALQAGREDAAPPKSNLELLRETLVQEEKRGMTFNFAAPNIKAAKNKQEIDLAIQSHPDPWYQLLVHPKVAESAANMYNGAEQTRASVMQTAQTAMAVYQDPLIRKNTAVSDFALRDLLDPSGEVSLYLVLQPNDIDKLRPILRLFVNTMLAKLVRDMKFDTKKGTAQTKKQRLLLMLDEFPQLGKLESIEKTLAICAGYGIKICIVAQSMGQLNKIYTKDNAIPGNCHVQVYFTPTLEDGGGTAKTLSDTLGEKTIHSVSKSTNGSKILESSTSTSQIGRKLMTPDEVRRMPADRELVFVAGFRSIYGKKIRYYEEEFFTKRIKPPPAFSDTFTKVQTYAQLFAVHAADLAEIKERQQRVAEARAKEEERIQKKAETQTGEENHAAEKQPSVPRPADTGTENQAAAPAHREEAQQAEPIERNEEGSQPASAQAIDDAKSHAQEPIPFAALWEESLAAWEQADAKPFSALWEESMAVWEQQKGA
ncbi:type IV secretory system conjugative DNA transfer family protein [Mitsuokella sp. oral taxon 131]|uniref:type IV secretory system conjugative DNA transfer family protein n=1 Tax=Mitsuokella sp. oral taxon 131 TaxID=1321780 RepID=UPI0003AE0736|nr:type IV secretory system conjugative DNA transfer family protein [Mitsuokella sp. oral taxon 131]ERL03188.1 TraG/TraD family protein [Mitsuokella sp. oral taxon 131 str. W9106]